MTLKQAAEQLRYKDTSALHHAVRKGLLQTTRVGPMHLTTQEWLDAYVTYVKTHRGGKGKKRGPRQPNPSG